MIRKAFWDTIHSPLTQLKSHLRAGRHIYSCRFLSCVTSLQYCFCRRCHRHPRLFCLGPIVNQSTNERNVKRNLFMWTEEAKQTWVPQGHSHSHSRVLTILRLTHDIKLWDCMFFRAQNRYGCLSMEMHARGCNGCETKTWNGRPISWNKNKPYICSWIEESISQATRKMLYPS